jgi:glycosyltransferase involved in cell wall biosynthesis
MRLTPSRTIAIVGRIPPPYGGVTVHLFRLLARLRAEEIPFRFFDLEGRSDPHNGILPASRGLGLLRQLGDGRHACIHFHASNPGLVLLAGLLRTWRGRPIAFTLHGEGILHLCEHGHRLYRALLPRVLRKADHVFAINPTSPAKLLAHGVSADRITWTAAYLPPTPQESQAAVPEPIASFLEAHQQVVACQGSFGAMHSGQDIYRFDLIAHSLARLRLEFPALGAITLISRNFSSAHRDEVLSLRKRLGLEEHWLIHEVPAPAVPVYARASLFLRPTETEGDSLSVRECLDLSVPVVASDAAARPEGCVLFRRGDLDDLCLRTADLLRDLPQASASLADLPRIDYALSVLSYYRSVLGTETAGNKGRFASKNRVP